MYEFWTSSVPSARTRLPGTKYYLTTHMRTSGEVQIWEGFGGLPWIIVFSFRQDNHKKAGAYLRGIEWPGIKLETATREDATTSMAQNGGTLNLRCSQLLRRRSDGPALPVLFQFCHPRKIFLLAATYRKGKCDITMVKINITLKDFGLV